MIIVKNILKFLSQTSAINCAAFFATLGIFSIFSGSIYLWDSNTPAIVPSSKFLALPTLTLAAIFFLIALYQKRFRALSTYPFIIGILLVFISSWMQSPYSLFPAPLIRGELLLATLLLFFIPIESLRKILLPFTLGCLALIALLYWKLSEGALIFSDDLGTFFYRITLLNENFPKIPFYNPQWNAGLEQKDFFATGGILLYLLAKPIFFITKLELQDFFNFFVFFLGLILPVLSTFVACKILNTSKSAALIAALLALSANFFWLRWGFKYGTLGFITSTSLLPLILVLLAKIATQKSQTNWKHLAAFTAIFTLSILWPFSGVVIFPALLLCVFYCFKEVFKPKLFWTAIILVLINLPWITTYLRVGNLQHFLSMDSHQQHSINTELKDPTQTAIKTKKNVALKKQTLKPETKSILKYLRENITPVNPLLIFLLLPGILLLPKTSRVFYLVMSTWLLFLALVVATAKPQLELDRMFVVLSLIACVPAAVALERLLFDSQSSHAKKLACAFIFSFVIIGPLCTARFFTNVTYEKISYTSPVFNNIITAIKNQHQKTGGRILFSGCVIHEFENGHLAPLAKLTNVPLMASSHLHNLWWYQDIIPEEFRALGTEGIEEYLDLYNVTAVFAHDPKWRDYFRKKPAEYELKEKVGRFWLFERKLAKNNYTLSGEIKDLTQTSNSIMLTPLTKDIVLKFNYLPKLKASNCTVSAYNVRDAVKLIRLTECNPNQASVISWSRQ